MKRWRFPKTEGGRASWVGDAGNPQILLQVTRFLQHPGSLRWRTNFLFPGSRSVLLWLFFEAITTLQDTGGCRRRSIRRYKCFLWSSCSLGLLIGVSELWWFCAKSNVDIITDRVCCSIDFTLCVAFLDALVLFHLFVLFIFPAVACHGFEFFDCHCWLHVSIVSP